MFVINFDPYNTRTRDLERHFDPYGKILNIRIRRNFAFIQYELQEDATKALESTNMRYLVIYHYYSPFKYDLKNYIITIVSFYLFNVQQADGSGYIG